MAIGALRINWKNLISTLPAIVAGFNGANHTKGGIA